MLIKTTCYRYGDLHSENFELSESMEAFLDKLKSESEWVVYHTEYDNTKIVGIEYYSVHSEGKYSYHSCEVSADRYVKHIFSENEVPDIMIWDYADAPAALRYSIGGDEDWVALVKKDYYNNKYIPFLQSGGNSIGSFDVKKVDFENYWLFVGCHS